MIRFLCALGPTTIHQCSDLVLTVPKPTQQGYAINVSVTVRNSGELAGQEAVQCYVSVPKVDGLITPRFALRHFEKLTLGKGEARELNFVLQAPQLATAHADGSRSVLPGAYTVHVGGGQPGDPRAASPALSAEATIPGRVHRGTGY